VSSFWRMTAAILGKELRVEMRTREIVYTMVFFGLVIVVVFGFGLFERATAHSAAPGVLWTALLLAGTVSINRTFEREREGSCLTALILVPRIAWPLFLGKMLANLVFVLLTMAFVAPLVLLVFQFEHVANAGGVVVAVLLGAIGYATLGTLVGGMLSHVRMRAILLPLVLFPLVIPVFGIGVTSTSALLTEGDAEAVRLEVDPDPAPDAPIAIGLGGWRIETTAARAGGGRVAVAEALAEELQAVLDSGAMTGIRISRGRTQAGFTLVSTPGTEIGELHVEGLAVVNRREIESSGWGYLPVLAALDLLLLVVAGWLFGRLLE